MYSRPQFNDFDYIGGTGPYGPMMVIFIISLNIKFGVNRMFHVLKAPVYQFDLYGRYQSLWTDDDNFW